MRRFDGRSSAELVYHFGVAGSIPQLSIQGFLQFSFFSFIFAVDE